MKLYLCMLVMVIAFHEGDGLKCLHCDSISHPRFCQVLRTCGGGEVCFAKTVEASDGFKSYRLGCTSDPTLRVCNATSTNDRYHCLECCNTDLCNAGLCGETGYPDSRGPICYSCKSRLIGEPCNAVEYCGIDEMCSVSNTIIFSETVYSSGCSQKHICEAHTHGSGPHIVGRRAVRNANPFPDRNNKRNFSSRRNSEDELFSGRASENGLSREKDGVYNLSPGRSSTNDLISGQTSENDLFPGQASEDDLFPGQTSENDLFPGQASEDDLSPGNCYRCCQTDLCNDNCSVPVLAIDECSQKPCSSRGSRACINEEKGFRCACLPGYTGQRCDIDIDECASLPCRNGGTCMNVPGSYLCTCLPGFTDNNCSIDTNDCASSPCANGASCVDLVNGYDCLCPQGYTGRNCSTDIDDCVSSPCLHNGRCLNVIGGYICQCPTGYGGKRCSIDINECTVSPCMNNATCVDKVGGYNCACPAGYTGNNCEMNINECTSSPCMNNATCIDMVGGYNCACPAGYTGNNCEINIDDCVGVPCLHNGLCVDMVDGYQCVCPPEYGGKRCNLGPARACLEVQQLGLGNTSGVYTIVTPVSNTSLHVLCDMTTDGGGWTVFQNRFNGSVDFYRNFSEYEYGFGDINGEFWLGLKYIYELSLCQNVSLRIDLEKATGIKSYALYKRFYMTTGPDYKLRVADSSGPIRENYGMLYSTGFSFYTHDKDNGYGCAVKDHGGWWYDDCTHVNLNGLYVDPPGGYASSRAESGMIYRDFDSERSLKAVKMMLRRNSAFFC